MGDAGPGICKRDSEDDAKRRDRRDESDRDAIQVASGHGGDEADVEVPLGPRAVGLGLGLGLGTDVETAGSRPGWFERESELE